MLNTISAILQAAAASPEKRTIAVAAAHDRDVLEAVAEARRAGIAQAVLTGHGEKIREILRDLGEDPADYALVEADSDAQCAALAVAEVREGRANFLMKGLLGTGDLMRAVIDRDTGLRTGRLISHVMLYEAPGHKMLALTDGGMNTFPDLPKKVEILENAARVLRALGYETMNAACVCGAEVVNPKVPSMLDAKALTEMTDRWAPYGMQVCGPVGLDLAVSEAAC
ncbi:MAG: phosphate butyryltransferase, partial [Firmicutes bacterium]|nr:phosphate butyryltransferase [Bacillota bacterium]